MMSIGATAPRIVSNGSKCSVRLEWWRPKELRVERCDCATRRAPSFQEFPIARAPGKPHFAGAGSRFLGPTEGGLAGKLGNLFQLPPSSPPPPTLRRTRAQLLPLARRLSHGSRQQKSNSDLMEGAAMVAPLGACLIALVLISIATTTQLATATSSSSAAAEATSLAGGSNYKGQVKSFLRVASIGRGAPREVEQKLSEAERAEDRPLLFSRRRRYRHLRAVAATIHNDNQRDLQYDSGALHVGIKRKRRRTGEIATSNEQVRLDDESVAIDVVVREFGEVENKEEIAQSLSGSLVAAAKIPIKKSHSSLGERQIDTRGHKNLIDDDNYNNNNNNFSDNKLHQRNSSNNEQLAHKLERRLETSPSKATSPLKEVRQSAELQVNEDEIDDANKLIAKREAGELRAEKREEIVLLLIGGKDGRKKKGNSEAAGCKKNSATKRRLKREELKSNLEDGEGRRLTRRFEEQSVEQEQHLIELLAQFYAHTREVTDKLKNYLLIERFDLQHQAAENLDQDSSGHKLLLQNQQLQQLENSVGSGQDDNQLINLLTSGLSEEQINRLKMQFKADENSLAQWLREQQNKTANSSLASLVIEIADYPNRSMVVCHEGPKILVKPDASRFAKCYTESQWIDKLWSDLRLSTFHYPIIVFNLLIFLFGTTGNVFVCLSVRRNHQLRNVTNYFIVNLAFADFLVILICLPATGLWDLYLTWFFGTIPCKLIMFLQDVSISVSVLTLTAISIDRYYAICHPLKFKSSLNQAKRMIALIWLVSLLLMSPDLLYLSAKPSQDLLESGIDTVLYSDCNYNWSEESSKLFQFVKTILLYLIPFLLMFCAHFKILQALRLASTMALQELKSLPPFNADNALVISSGKKANCNSSKSNHIDSGHGKNSITNHTQHQNYEFPSNLNATVTNVTSVMATTNSCGGDDIINSPTISTAPPATLVDKTLDIRSKFRLKTQEQTRLGVENFARNHSRLSDIPSHEAQTNMVSEKQEQAQDQKQGQEVELQVQLQQVRQVRFEVEGQPLPLSPTEFLVPLSAAVVGQVSGNSRPLEEKQDNDYHDQEAKLCDDGSSQFSKSSNNCCLADIDSASANSPPSSIQQPKPVAGPSADVCIQAVNSQVCVGGGGDSETDLGQSNSIRKQNNRQLEVSSQSVHRIFLGDPAKIQLAASDSDEVETVAAAMVTSKTGSRSGGASSPPPSTVSSSSSSADRARGMTSGEKGITSVLSTPSVGGDHGNQKQNQFVLTMHNKNRIESRQRAAKMLSAIVVLFGLCYLPVHLINFLRQFIDNIPQNDATSTISMLAHSICYLNSAINPIIYNHMNSVFRQEFRKFLSWRPWRRLSNGNNGNAHGNHHNNSLNSSNHNGNQNHDHNVRSRSTVTMLDRL